MQQSPTRAAPSMSASVKRQGARVSQTQPHEALVVMVAVGLPDTLSPDAKRRTSVMVASPMKGRKTNTGNHAGQYPACVPAMPSSAAMNPSGTAPTSPRKTRAGGQLRSKKRQRRGDDRQAHERIDSARTHGSHGVGTEADDRHRRRQAVAAIHEIVQIGHPHEREDRQQRADPDVGQSNPR